MDGLGREPVTPSMSASTTRLLVALAESAFASCGHAAENAYRRLVPKNEPAHAGARCARSAADGLTIAHIG